MDGIEQRWQGLGFSSASIPRYSDLSGEELFAAIMNEKYKALFLNMQSWSDWRRTGYPNFIDSENNSTECGGAVREMEFLEGYSTLKKKRHLTQIVLKMTISMIV